ncbi:aromatic prenyl transferase [Metarhizium album ARSEF 1941]|uniref:Aromatic prenyl transferase n=1 Tax=Metarhizium album (strain ARSEF 1941) TaxID=1081103 RepID=A0A0B2WJW4_METAS|nr:aromatic prenyl transferase [Metarhizium album ARSEF 1941]KHN93999.1 aromatic prenyl transferase [Metarhizium album ARSEF 1941]
MAEQASTTNSLDQRYWLRHTVPPLLALLRAAGTYTAADQGEHVRLLCDHVVPNLGRRPTESRPNNSSLTHSGFPVELSLNLNAGKPKVRFSCEFLGPKFPRDDDDTYAVGALRQCLTSLSEELGFSTKWAEAFLDVLAPTPEEATVAQEKLQQWQTSLLPPGAVPKPASRLPFSGLAFDLVGSQARGKLYLSPQVKGLGSAKSMTETLWGVLRRLEPPMSDKAITAISEFLLERPGPPCVDMLCIDLASDQDSHDARVKLYVNTTSNSFNTVRQCMTLSGRRQDEMTLKGLEVLRSIWHLLLQEEQEVADDYEKPVNDASKLVMKLFFCLEITPGKDLPDVKLHVPIFNYLKSDREALCNIEDIFRKCNQEWAANGKYRETFESAFGDPNTVRDVPVHGYTAFAYNESGAYQTVYFGVPQEL